MATQTLTLTGDGAIRTGWNAEGYNYTKLNSDDGDTSKIYSPTDLDIVSFALLNTSGLSGATINSVTVYAKMSSISSYNADFKIGVRLSGTNYLSATKTHNEPYTLYSEVFTTNPATSSAWTTSEIDGMEPVLQKIGGAGSRCTWMYVVVDYTVGITFDAVSNSGYQAASSSYSWSHTNAGDFLAVDVSRFSVPGTTVTSVTFNGDALTNIGTKASGTDAGNVSSWGMVAPDIGTYNIVVTLSAVAISASTAVSYGGVHQTSPTEAFNGATAVNVGAADAIVFVTSVADNCWIHAAVASTDTSVTANDTGSGVSSRNNVTGAGGSGANMDTGPITPASTIEENYTDIGAAQTWVIAGYALRPVTASSIATNTSNFFMFFN